MVLQLSTNAMDFRDFRSGRFNWLSLLYARQATFSAISPLSRLLPQPNRK